MIRYVMMCCALMCVGACQSDIVMSPCPEVPERDLVTVEDYILRVAEVEGYLRACRNEPIHPIQKQ